MKIAFYLFLLSQILSSNVVKANKDAWRDIVWEDVGLGKCLDANGNEYDNVRIEVAPVSMFNLDKCKQFAGAMTLYGGVHGTKGTIGIMHQKPHYCYLLFDNNQGPHADWVYGERFANAGAGGVNKSWRNLGFLGTGPVGYTDGDPNTHCLTISGWYDEVPQYTPVTFDVNNVAMADSGAAWNMSPGGVNEVEITFESNGYNFDDYDFGLEAASGDCGSDTVPATVSDKEGFVVQFTNPSGFNKDQTYCTVAGLTFGTQGVVASTKITITATASLSGSVDVVYTLNDADLKIQVSDLKTNAFTKENGEVSDVGITVDPDTSSLSDGPILFGMPVIVGLKANTGTEITITGVSDPVDLTDFQSLTSGNGGASCQFFIPLKYYDDTSIDVTLSVDYNIVGRRGLEDKRRGLQEDVESGAGSLPLTLELAPIEGSGGYDINVVSAAALGALGLTAVVLEM